MDKIDSNPPSLTLFPASVSGPESACRFIVLVPDLEWEYVPAIHRIWELANAQHARVLLISLCKDSSQELSLRRALVILCAMLQNGKVPVETDVEIGMNWVDVVKRNYRTGDTIVCFAEQRAGLFYRPLSQVLQSNLDIPIYILSGLYPPRPSTLRMFPLFAMWLGFISIIAGFFLLQIRVVSLPRDWAQTTMLILSVIAELWLIWIWNNLFS